MDEHILARHRNELMKIGLAAYRKPLYQVLAINEAPVRAVGSLQSFDQIVKRIGEGRK